MARYIVNCTILRSVHGFFVHIANGGQFDVNFVICPSLDLCCDRLICPHQKCTWQRLQWTGCVHGIYIPYSPSLELFLLSSRTRCFLYFFLVVFFFFLLFHVLLPNLANKGALPLAVRRSSLCLVFMWGSLCLAALARLQVSTSAYNHLWLLYLTNFSRTW